MILNLTNTRPITLNTPHAEDRATLRNRVLRLFVPRMVRGSSLVDDTSAHVLLRRIEAFGYRVSVWRIADVNGPGLQRLGMSAENDWAMCKHVVYVAAGPGDEAACANALADEVALEMEE